MSNDDYAAFDLSAWDVPSPPAGLADAVIDQVRSNASAAVPVEEHAAPRRAWIVGGAVVAVIALAIGVWSLAGSTHQAAPASGHVVAERARSLSLETVHADLDVGAEVRWQRQAGVLHVEQRAGRVAWRVDRDEKLVIDAAVASVEATGANLRVEVQMNATDARVIGASALTAAAVAMLTVVVYEGHVNVNRPGQQTVVVAPGSTYQVNPTPELVGGTVGNKPKVAILGLEHVVNGAGEQDTPAMVSVMRATAKSEGPYQLAPNSDKELVDEKMLMNCANEAGPCMAAIGANLGVDALVFGDVETTSEGYFVQLKLLDVRTKTITRTVGRLIPFDETDVEGLDNWGRRIYLSLVRAAPVACDAEALTDKALENVLMDRHAEALEALEASLACRRDPYVLGRAFVAACKAGNSAKQKLYFDQLTPAQQSKLSKHCRASAKKATCDATALKERGLENINMGQHAAALALLEASLACKPDPYVLQLAFMEACSSSNSAKAKQYYKQLTPVQQAKLEQICKRQQVAYTDDVTPVDSSLPEGLDRQAITKVMAQIRTDVVVCGKQTKAGGKVKLRVEVNPAGVVTTVEVIETPTPVLAKCIAHVVQKSTFSPTQKGGSFTYPFIVPEP